MIITCEIGADRLSQSWLTMMDRPACAERDQPLENRWLASWMPSADLNRPVGAARAAASDRNRYGSASGFAKWPARLWGFLRPAPLAVHRYRDQWQGLDLRGT